MTPANLDLTLLNIVPTKTVVRKKHRPDDETLNSQPGDEAEPQWAASDTQSEASAIGGESYQLAQATIPASAASAATAAAPVIESTLFTNLLLAGAVVGGAAAFVGGKTRAAPTATPTSDTTIHNIVDGVVTAGPVIPGNGLTVNLYKADGTTLLGSGGLNVAGQFRIDVGSYTGAVIAKVVDTNTAADYMDEATGLDKDLNANLMAVSVVTGGTITLNINPVTTIAAIKAGLTSGGSGSVTATSVAEANTAVAAAFGVENITTTVPVTTVSLSGTTSSAYFPGDGLSAGEKYGALLASLSGADKNNGGNTQTTINNLAAAISGTGATATLTTTGQIELVNGATTADANTTGNLTGIFDTRPLVSISAAGDTVKNEGSTLSFNQTYSFTVTRSHGNGASTADYAVDGVADAVGRVGATASDFGLGTSPLMPHGTVSFASGETSKTITVSVAGDQVTERDENFSVTLLSPTNATLGIGTSVQATILNDDHATLTAAQIFSAQGASSTGDHTAGYIRVMADFSKAAYDLQPWETASLGGRIINDKSPLADKALDAVLAEGWELLTLNPTLDPTSLAAPSDPVYSAAGLTVTNRMDNGYYTKGNAAALVARSTDSLVIAFRGANDNAPQYTPTANPNDPTNNIHPDADDWGTPFDGASGDMRNHYNLFIPLFNSIKSYVELPENSGITRLYITGHSLGGAMANEFIDAASTRFNLTLNGVTFAAPAFTTSTDGIQQKTYLANSHLIHIEIDEDPVAQGTWLVDKPGKVLTFAGNNTGDEPYNDAIGRNWNDDNHTMDYYRQITRSVDPESWQIITAQSGDQAIAIGATSGPNFDPLVYGVDRHQADPSNNPFSAGDKFDTSFLVDGRVTDTVSGAINRLLKNPTYSRIAIPGI